MEELILNQTLIILHGHRGRQVLIPLRLHLQMDAFGTSVTTVINTSSSPPSTTCNLIYVSPSGGGDGQTKSSPTTIQSALSSAQCNNVVIKMQTGLYSISDFLPVSSFITIEGGYNSTFTSKTSDINSGAATRIVRNTTPDSDNTSRCSAFIVAAGSTGFRFQDLRIELPTTHANNSSISNYGILLGASCAGYNIVRCYINAGNGSSATP
jgi:hypothetical protein